MIFRKKNKKNAKAIAGYTTGIVGAGLIGSALPANTGAPLTSAASAGAPFVGPMVNVFGAGLVLDSLDSLDPKRLRKKKMKGGRK